jgi:hypothetical protein
MRGCFLLFQALLFLLLLVIDFYLHNLTSKASFLWIGAFLLNCLIFVSRFGITLHFSLPSTKTLFEFCNREINIPQLFDIESNKSLLLFRSNQVTEDRR